jgi:cystine transport system substrate-binding protein
VVINQITITPERQAKYDFSEPYTVSGIQIIVRKGQAGIAAPNDLAGKKVGVGLGTNYEQLGPGQRAHGRRPHL